MRGLVVGRVRRGLALVALALVGQFATAGAQAAGLVGGAAPLVWSPSRPVLTLSGAPVSLSPLVVDGGRQYLVGMFNGTLDLLTNAGGSWRQYPTGISDYVQNSGEGFYGLAVSSGVAYVPYIDRQRDVKLAYDPSGPSGPWHEVTVVPHLTNGLSCGLGLEAEAPVVAVASDEVVVAFDDSAPCHGGANADLNVYVATAPIGELGAGGSPPTWHVSGVTVGYAVGGMFPALAADGQGLDLAYQLDNNSSDMGFVQGTRATAGGFAWPAKPTIFAVNNQGMDRPKMFLAAGGTAGVQDAAAVFAGGNVVDMWAATLAGGRWTSTPLARNLGDGDQRPSAALGDCGPSVSYQLDVSSTGMAAVATRVGSRWVTQRISPAEVSEHDMWPQVALTAPDAVQLLFLDDDSGRTVLYGAVGYCPAHVAAVTPRSGPNAGRTAVTVSGTAFTGATAVSFGGAPALSFKVVSDSELTAVAPKGSGVVPVHVVTAAGVSSTGPGGRFVYLPPRVTAVSPAVGPAAGGTSVVITGRGFSGASAVYFGKAKAAAFSVGGDTRITAKSPAGKGTVDVTVQTSGGVTAAVKADQFTYTG